MRSEKIYDFWETYVNNLWVRYRNVNNNLIITKELLFIKNFISLHHCDGQDYLISMLDFLLSKIHNRSQFTYYLGSNRDGFRDLLIEYFTHDKIIKLFKDFTHALLHPNQY